MWAAEWELSKDMAVHPTGLRVRFTPLPHGTRGKDVAFQDEHGDRWIARAEHTPMGIAPMMVRKMLMQGAREWVNARMQRHRRW